MSAQSDDEVLLEEAVLDDVQAFDVPLEEALLDDVEELDEHVDISLTTCFANR